MKKIFTLYLTYSLFVVTNSFSQNIGIGTTTPNSSAMLDVQSNNKGMLVPRIALTSANTALPVTSPADALLVYNTATAGVGSNAVVPGFYYWSTTANRWSSISPTLSTVNTGYGSWGDCSGNSISEYNPVADENSVDNGFGSSVSISGNYAIIGDPKDVAGGSASIYQFNGTNWIFMQKIIDATGDIGNWFGVSVSISGNYAIVGALYDDNGANSNQGSASIFQYSGTNWVLMQKIVNPTGATNDYSGVGVSISDNYAVIGAYGTNIGAGPFQGAANIYHYNGSNWIWMQQITDPTGAAGDSFGGQVSISGTFIIAGSSLDDIGANLNQGSACIFRYTGASWVFMQKITDGSGAANDFFGENVSISGNYAIVGASLDDVGANTNQGSASIYRYDGTSWILMQKITDPNGAVDDRFGVGVSIAGNYAIIGAVWDDIGSNSNQGSASIYVRVGSGWQRLQYLTDPGGGNNETFGGPTALDGTTKRFLIRSGGPIGLGKVVFGKIN